MGCDKEKNMAEEFHFGKAKTFHPGDGKGTNPGSGKGQPVGEGVAHNTNESSLTIEALVENLDTVIDFVTGRIEGCGCDMKTQLQIEMAVEELFVNIAHYAYNPEVGTTTVRVEMQEDPLAVAITFIDQGRPYDPLAKEDPDIEQKADDRVGGLGIFMVKKSMDNISYEYKDGKNILRIQKNI